VERVVADLLVTGTLALDDVRTPFGEVADALGEDALEVTIGRDDVMIRRRRGAHGD